MVDISFSNFFGVSNDFENLKKWFRINSDSYKDILIATKERCDLEAEYSSRLSKINTKLLKSFSQSIGPVSGLWSKAAILMNEESEAHRTLGNEILDDVYKPLVAAFDQFHKSKKPIEIDIDRCSKIYQEKKDEQLRSKKRALMAAKEAEKAYESISEYKAAHGSLLSANVKERVKIEKRAAQLNDFSIKAESEYFDSYLLTEESRCKWEQTYLKGLDQLQKLESERLISMKSIIQSYQKCVSNIPIIYKNVSSMILKEINSVNINEDLIENANESTNKCPTVYKTEQIMMDVYAESKEYPMDRNRRKDNLIKSISSMYQVQKKTDNLCTGALKMLTVYEDSPQFSDELTRSKTKQEYAKTLCLLNLLSANLFKLQVALNSFDNKPEPNNPLVSAGVRIVIISDRNGLPQSILESKPGTVIPFYEHGLISRSSSKSEFVDNDINSFDDDDEFDTDSDNEPPPPQPRVLPQVTRPLPFIASKPKPISQQFLNNNPKPPLASRPLPSVPPTIRCKALHDFVGRDGEELSFFEGNIITVKKKLNDVWWEGELKGKLGLIPVNYVKELM